MEIEKGNSGGANEKTIINRIMLRFRPIAPKPLAGGSDAGSMGVGKSDMVTNQRKKRKYVRGNKNNKTKEEGRRDVMLEGLPSPRGVTEAMENGSSSTWSFSQEQYPILLRKPDHNNSNNSLRFGGLDKSDRAAVAPSRRVVESWLVVDGMSETYVGVGVLGDTDREKTRNLEADVCPGLISDGEQRVRWMNRAYKKMVDAEGEMAVYLVLKQKIPERWGVFTCSVRVVYTWHKEKHSQTMPCDVWRMDFGGFAWRLDAQAALKLGR